MQNFKVYYRKLLFCYIIIMIIDYDSVIDIVKILDVLQVIRWMGIVWFKVKNDIIIKCFVVVGIFSFFLEVVIVSFVIGEEDFFVDFDVLVDEELEWNCV